MATPPNTWKKNGVPTDFYRNTVWVPGERHSDCPYTMKEVSGFGTFILHKSRINATRSAVLYHQCNDE